MKVILGIFVVALALVLGGTLAQPIADRYASDTTHAHVLQLLDEQRQAFDVQQYQIRQAATLPGKIAGDYGLAILLFVGASALTWVLIDSYRQRRVPLVKPDSRGYLPVARSAVERGELVALLADAIHAAGVAQIEESRRQLPPHVYSPHMTYAPRISSTAAPALPDDQAAYLAAAPAFADLLSRARVGRGNPLLLGFDVDGGQELTGSWLDLYSTAVSGMPGSGKTTSQRFLACQTALHGARFALCDPHAGAADDSLAATLAPLASVFVCMPASTDKTILEVVRYVADVGRRRVEGKDEDTTPLILWVDELTALLGRSSIADDLADLLERVAQEYRKRFVFVCASGQIWTAARTTSELRDSFASVLCHRMKRNQARLLLPTEEAERVERLATGCAILWRTSGATHVVTIPNTTAQDCVRVAGLLTSSQPTMATNRHTDMPQRSQFEAGVKPTEKPASSQNVATGVWLPNAPASAEARRAAQLFMAGADPAAIVWELRQVKSSQGGKYQTALAEVLGLIRAGVASRG